MALIQCPECNKDVSSNAPSCPNCGAPIAAISRKSKSRGYVPYSDSEVAVMLSQKNRTNNILHLLLCIPTFGGWIFIWILVAILNSMGNSAIDKKIEKGKRIKI